MIDARRLYLTRRWAWALGVAAGLCATAAHAQRGDVCSEALPLPVVEACAVRPELYSTRWLQRASPPREACGHADGGVDAWFSFEAPTTGAVNVRVASQEDLPRGTVSLLGPRFELYGGSCGALRLLGCGENASGATTIASLAREGLRPGRTYYLRVSASEADPRAQGAFTVCVRAFRPRRFAESDCVDGATLCSLDPIRVDALNGAGTDRAEVTRRPCGILETNSVWYRWTAATDGELAFRLTPGARDADLDFVVYDLGVGGLATCPLDRARIVACNGAGGEGCVGVTGLRRGDPTAFEGPGCNDGSLPRRFHDGFSAPVPIVAGRDYAVIINEYDALGGGFAIDFAGSTFAPAEPSARYSAEVYVGSAAEPEAEPPRGYRLRADVGGLVYAWDLGAGVSLLGGRPDGREIVVGVAGPNAGSVALTVRSVGGCSATSRSKLAPPPSPRRPPAPPPPPKAPAELEEAPGPATAPSPAPATATQDESLAPPSAESTPEPERIVRRARVVSGEQLRFPGVGTARLGVFDHKRVDGDTVSVSIDGRLVLDRVGLARAPTWTPIALAPGTHTLTLFAENLGAVEPNTATVVVEVGEVRRSAVLSSDLGESATLEIRVGGG